jgi:outer membrane PBP1 activator LpoA protein
MNKIMVLSLIILSACASTPARESIHFFQGKANDDCEFVEYLDAYSSKDTEEKSYDEAKRNLMADAKKDRANMLKVVNVNRTINAISLSAEAYYCSNLLQLKISDDSKMDFRN